MNIQLANKQFIHSTRNPQKEAQRQATELLSSITQSTNAKESSGLVVIGLGAGYLLECIAKVQAGILNQIFIVEPLAEVFDSTIIRSQLAQYIDLETQYFCSEQELIAEIKKTNLVNIQFYTLPVYRRYYHNKCNQLRNQIEIQLQTQGSQKLRQQQNNYRWLNNSLQNITRPKHSLKYISRARNKKYRDSKTLVFCGAGPGLKQDLDSLGIEPAERRNDCFVVVSDTALFWMLRNQYQVDLCVSIDAGPGTWYHFAILDQLEGIQIPLKLPLLAWHGSPPWLFKFFKDVLYYRSTLPFDQLLGMGPLSKIAEWQNPSKNVAGLSLLIAQTLGIPKTVLAGTSFQVQKNQSHIQGTGYNYYSQCHCNRLNGLSVYRPTQYKEKSDLKNPILQKLIDMADTNGIELLQAGQKHTGVQTTQNRITDLSINPQSGSAGLALDSDSVDVNSRVAAKFLLQQLQSIHRMRNYNDILTENKTIRYAAKVSNCL